MENHWEPLRTDKDKAWILEILYYFSSANMDSGAYFQLLMHFCPTLDHSVRQRTAIAAVEKRKYLPHVVVWDTSLRRNNFVTWAFSWGFLSVFSKRVHLFYPGSCCWCCTRHHRIKTVFRGFNHTSLFLLHSLLVNNPLLFIHFPPDILYWNNIKSLWGLIKTFIKLVFHCSYDFTVKAVLGS